MIGQLEQCPENARLLIFQRLDPVSAADVIDAPSSGGEALIVLMPALNERCRIVVGTDFIATAALARRGDQSRGRLRAIRHVIRPEYETGHAS